MSAMLQRTADANASFTEMTKQLGPTYSASAIQLRTIDDYHGGGGPSCYIGPGYHGLTWVH